jgi:hypothetical protein
VGIFGRGLIQDALELETQVIEVALRNRMGEKFLDHGLEVSQRADARQWRQIRWARQTA